MSVPGERWEIEFSKNGDIEVEIFRCDGTIFDESILKELFNKFSECYGICGPTPRRARPACGGGYAARLEVTWFWVYIILKSNPAGGSRHWVA